MTARKILTLKRKPAPAPAPEPAPLVEVKAEPPQQLSEKALRKIERKERVKRKNAEHKAYQATLSIEINKRKKQRFTELLKKLPELYPEVFDIRKFTILAIGISKQLRPEILELGYTAMELRKVLHFWTTRKKYLNNFFEQEYRINLDGSQAQKITKIDIEFTKERQKKAHANWQRRQQLRENDRLDSLSNKPDENL